jgi:formimidoylglutamate deiminase
MSQLFARKVLLQDGWSDNVRLSVRAGRIGSIEIGATPDDGEPALGIVIPGLGNGHSHAFQRALAGHTEQRSPADRDTFWTWREKMYELAARMDAEALAAIAAQAYCEMLASGYTAVAEFHYLHTTPGDAGDDAMLAAILDAAEQSGIRVTYVPVLYERGGFNEPEPQGRQGRFAMDVATFVEHFERARRASSKTLGIGIGAHSLRAVSPASLAEIAAIAERHHIPLHLHIAEQQREVEQCLASYGRRPVRWLLEHFDVGSNWCLVHATHMDFDETSALAKSGAVTCLCPSTEANLGDGLFPLQDYLAEEGAIAIGSDSHVSINPFEELRWLEYGQRLASQSRNVASLCEAHVGRELFQRALAGGAQACGLGNAGLAEGAYADLVVLDDDDPMLVGHGDTSLLDALVFSGYRLPIERVMVHGRWQVIDGRHRDEQDIRTTFAANLRRLGAAA